MTTPLIPDKQAFRMKVEKLSNLPTLPHLMIKFSKMIKDPTTSIADFGEEIGKDQTLTSKMLRLVNSAYYGFPGRISTVTQALVLLGFDAVKGLIVTSNVFSNITPEAFPLWRHSMLVSLACRQIGAKLNIPDLEEIIVAGLLHDIGKVIFYMEEPDTYRLVVRKAVELEMPVWKAEQEFLGFDHATLGEWLCEKWLLPEKLKIPIAFHHRPEQAKAHQQRVAVVAFANTFIKALGAMAEPEIPLEDLPASVTALLPLTQDDLLALANNLQPEVEALSNMTPTDV